MGRKLIITREAETDILDAYLVYEEKQNGLGGRFIDEVDLAFDRILLNPFLYQEIEPDIQRAVTHKFPYLVFYTLNARTVHILAVIHDAQDPAYINERLDV